MQYLHSSKKGPTTAHHEQDADDEALEGGPRVMQQVHHDVLYGKRYCEKHKHAADEPRDHVVLRVVERDLHDEKGHHANDLSKWNMRFMRITMGLDRRSGTRKPYEDVGNDRRPLDVAVAVDSILHGSRSCR